MNKNTYAELAELRKEQDPAAAVTYKFIEEQKKLVAYRLSRLSDEWESFQENVCLLFTMNFDVVKNRL